MEKTGAEIIVECLEREGVKFIFGIPGGANLPFFDKIYDSKIRMILTRHEQGASHMADAFSRATGEVGVCTATSGPGATNLVTGLATANMDSIPIVAITGQVRTDAIGRFGAIAAPPTAAARPTAPNVIAMKRSPAGRSLKIKTQITKHKNQTNQNFQNTKHFCLDFVFYALCFLKITFSV
jgi:acetolactate synthase-1/2/3 large subunit